MITVAISVKDGAHTRGEILELEELGAEELARVEALVHEMRDHLERIARRMAAKRAKDGAG